MNRRSPTTTQASSKRFDSAESGTSAPIDAIVIGTSAGGIEALGVLLPALPPNFAPAVVIVLHLPSHADSTLAQLFSARCRLPIREACDREPVQGGTVYFAPPGYHLMINPDHTCALSLEEPVHFSRPSIDVLFESAAWTYGERLLGILLTGASADGANGMGLIRDAGGITWAQAPDTARSTAMPLAAIEQETVDHIMTLEAMAAELNDKRWQTT